MKTEFKSQTLYHPPLRVSQKSFTLLTGCKTLKEFHKQQKQWKKAMKKKLETSVWKEKTEEV